MSTRKRKIEYTDSNPCKKRKVSTNESKVDDNNVKATKCSKCAHNVSKDVFVGSCCMCNEDYGCSECDLFDHGFFCSQCNKFYCYDCYSDDYICDTCLEMYCTNCIEFKPVKGGGAVECEACQPWWKKNKPASAFCFGCGSARSNADICTGCNKRWCEQCPTFTCEECGEMECENCNRMEICEGCDGTFCLDCEHECDN
mmetsp:Transcript_15991/g.24573  ORF Transcript_15991/g.24573 Transcript_15991/m.24573 type:complete len:199 (+) Transcript_15991:34-630(+)